MRPPRIIIAAAFIFTTLLFTFVSLRSSHPPHTISSASPAGQKTGINAFFSFHAPFNLFPPNAIITLTHDNTTAFLARPAGFGPSLPLEGLKGQVWIGSGFGDVAAGGELGCSDAPGWEDSFAKSGAVGSEGGKPTDKKSATTNAKVKAPRRPKNEKDGPFDHKVDSRATQKGTLTETPINDGTDDYLHQPSLGSAGSKPAEKQSVEAAGNHADIQSIQEGAEIAGKVVLLSRGGCGFLEKVKWAQRRGAIAVIVGDDTKGQPLIIMYGRGDTSNVTIPSIFTSYTTAHLLSSLVGPGSFIEDMLDENGKPVLHVQHTKPRKKKYGSRPTFTPTASIPKATGIQRPGSKVAHKKGSSKTEDKTPMTTEKPGWFRSLFFGSKGQSKDNSRPPSSGQLDWVLVDDWKDDDESRPRKISTNTNKQEPVKKPAPKTKVDKHQNTATEDDFVIGVHDWRDPDLVVTASTKEEDRKEDIRKGKSVPPKNDPESGPTTKNTSPPPPPKGGKKHLGGALQEIPDYHAPLRGGSITPGSGQYPNNDGVEGVSGTAEESKEEGDSGGKSKGLLTAIFGDDEEDVEFLTPKKTLGNSDEGKNDDGDEHEGLWVTLTPSSGASPFLDTLLVLVVSPLITLTVVYTLLLIRSRIRRRRWRAPKSVVERLPVRTYQTIVSPGSQSPRFPSLTSSSATTPLLQSTTPSRPRQRSHTTTGVPEPGDLLRVDSAPLQVPSMPPRAPEHEKNASESSEWKKHMGKQVECVICLEDYIEGVSRVMSLPCGHEFHADCITPWLTTRRRTCPICKGDVVRSLARGTPSSPRYEPYHDDDSEDDDQDRAQTSNTSSSSALPIYSSESESEDVEQGAIGTSTGRTQAQSSWRELLASSLGSVSRIPRLPQVEEDRTR